MANRFDIQFERANLLLDAHDFEAARSLLEEILEQEPDNARALHALGVVIYRGWGKSRHAVRLIRKSLALRSDFADAYNNLAKILQESGRIRAAIACYRQSVSIAPDNHIVWMNMGIACNLAKRPEDAIVAFQDAYRLAPTNFDVLMGIGRALVEMKRFQESLDYFDKAGELAPNDATVHYCSAFAHKQLKQLAIARTKLLRALELKPDYVKAYRGLAEVLLSLGDADASVKAARKALTLDPDFKDAYTFLLFALHYPATTTQQELFNETIEFCRRFLSSIPRCSHHDNDRTPDRTLRVGYISGEFHRHPVGFFIEQILALHDTKVVSTYCYSNGATTDWLTERLKEYAGVWRNISGLCDETVVRQIQQDAIDILVDLSGHIGHGRMQVMARKPAPVQVSWIGYYNTTGLDTMDYILMDEDTVPSSMVKWFTERVVYLPESRFCYTPPPDFFEVKQLPALRKGFVTFGCFNNISKITPLIIDVWSTILKRIPDALLVLKWESFSDVDVVERFQILFEQRGVASSRIEFRKSSSYDILLEEYGDIDIALDPFPFSGATTTCEALWMGVPVITMPGALPAARQSMALLRVIGLSNFIADSRESYVELALHHALDLQSLAELRQRLRCMMLMSPLCDGQRFVVELESAYREIWHHWCEGLNSIDDQSPIEIHPAVTNVKTIGEAKYLSAIPEAAYNRGVSYMSTKNWREANRLFKQACAYRADFPEALNNLGIVSYHLGELEAAESWFDKAIQLCPDFVEALNNQGKILTALKKEKEAFRFFSKVLRLDPCHHQAWNNLGELYFNSGRIVKARACFRRALMYQPDFVEALSNLAILYLQYNTVKSLGFYHRLIEICPNVSDVHVNMIFAMHYSENISREEILRNIRNWGDRFCNNDLISHNWVQVSRKTEHRPLKVGFVSADFHQHPGGVFFQALARYHDKSQFSFVCYDNSGKRDMITDDIKRHVECWRNITGSTDNELINLIQSDAVDILIDLSGFTAGNRLSLFARKPAPAQASWLGWFNTTGMNTMDYLIVDPIMVQEGEELFFVEKTVCLPEVRFCYTPPFLCPDVEELPAENNGHITFGCFNNLAKINDCVVGVWINILKRVQQSRLVLKSPYFRDYEMRRRFIKRFETYGIAAERLELRPHSSHFFMMAEYGDIDIALDPFPYCGGLTSCESLWMGVPVITLSGELPVSRQTESFLRAIGLQTFIARSEMEYIELACELATDHRRLSEIRAGLRDRMVNSSLCDGKRFSAAFGDLLNKMWSDTVTASQI